AERAVHRVGAAPGRGMGADGEHRGATGTPRRRSGPDARGAASLRQGPRARGRSGPSRSGRHRGRKRGNRGGGAAPGRRPRARSDAAGIAPERARDPYRAAVARPPLGAAATIDRVSELFDQIDSLRRVEGRAALATLVSTHGTTPRKEGAKMWVGEGGR